MDKKYLIKVIVLNTLWIIWIALSIFFGCLIADAYFPDNMATFIPFSIIFIVAGGGLALVVYKFVFKKKVTFSDKQTEVKADKVSASVTEGKTEEDGGMENVQQTSEENDTQL